MHISVSLYAVYEMGLTITNYTLDHPKMKKLLASKQKFDVVIVECFVSEAMLGIADHFNAPVVSMATFGAHKWNTDQVGSELSKNTINIINSKYSKISELFNLIRR